MNAITLIWKRIQQGLGMFSIKEESKEAEETQKTEKTVVEEVVVEVEQAVENTVKREKKIEVGKEKEEKETERRQPVRLTQEVRTFLQEHYDFRYNLLTEETEFRPIDGCGVPFEPIGKRELNTFWLDALAHRVSDRPLWVKSFHTWMLGLTAQWAGMTGIHANSVAPILVSSEQGRQKSTFCKSLMPPVLSRYYMDNLKLSAQGKAERLLAEMGLLNMDEFDKYGTQQMPLLKNLMQMANLNICKAYQKNFRNLPRIASFIGTSNRFDLLSDPTGSRRFICIEVEHIIDCEGIAHDPIYAQLKAELLSGARYWFTKEEERELQRHNAAFYRPCPAEEVFHSCFRTAEPGDEGYESLSASDIFRRLKMYNPTAMRGSNPATFAQVLLAAGVVRKHTKYGNVYLVKPLKAL